MWLSLVKKTAMVIKKERKVRLSATSLLMIECQKRLLIAYGQKREIGYHYKMCLCLLLHSLEGKSQNLISL